MRGTPLDVSLAAQCLGIIPAHAGNTRHLTATASSTGDHPRACGEHHPNVGDHLKATGSSPRMRGTRSIRNSRTIHPGIIPAHAGNTGALRRSVSHGRDHPRACGEHLISLWRVRHGGDHPRACGEHAVSKATSDSVKGSSPRMRGTPERTIQCSAISGIIPAHAGNTLHNA